MMKQTDSLAHRLLDKAMKSGKGWGNSQSHGWIVDLMNEYLTKSLTINANKMKKEIKKFHIENDVVNNEPKLIVTDEDGVEWVMSSKTACSEGAAIPAMIKKQNDWFFNKTNANK